MNDITLTQISDLYQYQGWLQHWLHTQLPNRETAEDLTQDTYVRAIKNQHRSPEEITYPKGYLRCIAHALLVNHWRRCDIEKALFEVLSVIPEVQTPSAEETVIMLDTLVQLDHALSTLPEATRTAFLLSRFDRLTYAEIASRLYCSQATVKRHIQRALVACLWVMDD